jgi:hypothetical protein
MKDKITNEINYTNGHMQLLDIGILRGEVDSLQIKD